MPVARVSKKRSLQGLKNISWLTSRQLNRLDDALMTSRVAKEGIIFDEKRSPESAYVLLSGVARITCRNRKGERTLVIMVAPGMIPGIPSGVSGINYSFRCEAVTECRIGTITLAIFIEIALGIASADFKRMAASYTGRWDLVQLRCSNFMACTLEEARSVDTPGTRRKFRCSGQVRGAVNGSGAPWIWANWWVPRVRG